MILKHLDKIYENAQRITIDDATKIVIMSDCHRGAGNNFDNFLKNKNIYLGALRHYYYRNFTYIELGDGDDMWEVKNYKDIIEEHLDVFKMIKMFHRNKRFKMIYGNHDMVKKYHKILKDNFYTYRDNNTNKKMELLTDLEVYESLILEYNELEIFLLHGHQVDFFNNNFWRLSRFFVRHIWRPLEYVGIKDPTSSAKKYNVSNGVEKKLQKWSNKNHKLLIAGHTHRPVMSNVGESLYFNDGSCIHPNGITCIEIEDGKISLVKWEYNINRSKKINIKRTVLVKSVPLTLYY